MPESCKCNYIDGDRDSFLLTTQRSLSGCWVYVSSRSRYDLASSTQNLLFRSTECTMMDKSTATTIKLFMSMHGPNENSDSDTLYTRNMAFIKSLTESKESIQFFQEKLALLNTDIEERSRCLRETVGLTKNSLKLYINRYPSICLEMFTTPVKSSKSVICRYLEISEAQYAVSLRKIQIQTHNKAGSLFRGSFFFIRSYLQAELNFDKVEIRQLFINYPTFFVFSLGHIRERVQLLFSKYKYSLPEIKYLIKRNGRTIFYSDNHFNNLRVFFLEEVGISSEQFCSITTREPRLISSSLERTIMPKYKQLLNLWNLSNDEVVKILRFAPNVLTTKPATSAKLYDFLRYEVCMSDKSISTFIVRYGGFLRINVGTLKPKLITFVVIQLVCATFIRGTKMEEMESKQPNEEVLDSVASIFRRISKSILERDAMVLTFSQQRIQDRMLSVLLKLNFKNSTPHDKIIALIHRILQGCDSNYDTNMNTFIKRYVSEMSHVGVNVLTKSVIDGEVLLPIHPQYSISFNDKKFNDWLNKIEQAGIDNEYSL